MLGPGEFVTAAALLGTSVYGCFVTALHAAPVTRQCLQECDSEDFKEARTIG